NEHVETVAERAPYRSTDGVVHEERLQLRVGVRQVAAVGDPEGRTPEQGVRKTEVGGNAAEFRQHLGQRWLERPITDVRRAFQEGLRRELHAGHDAETVGVADRRELESILRHVVAQDENRERTESVPSRNLNATGFAVQRALQSRLVDSLLAVE